MAKNETEAITQVDKALDGLQKEEAARVLRWASDKYGDGTPGTKLRGDGGRGHSHSTTSDHDFSDVSDLITTAEPSNNYERALVVGYWFQEVQGEADFTGQQINTELTNLGHRCSNITEVFTNLMKRKPALATQTKKSGKSRQARKRYKLTKAGIDKVKRMLSGTDSDD
jgi:hypothetical protein